MERKIKWTEKVDIGQYYAHLDACPGPIDAR
jgi:hypothetical protein